MARKSGITLDVLNDKELMRQVRDMAPNSRTASIKAMREWAKETRRIARREQPKRITGKLRNATHYKVNKRRLSAWVGFDSNSLEIAPYAGYVHEGTERIKANRFLDRAFAKATPFRVHLAKTLDKELLP